MKTFKDFKSFEKKLNKEICWSDYFKVDGKQFKIYEFGDMDGHEYAYFYNKRSKIMLLIKYKLPYKKYDESKLIQLSPYKFISLEVQENPMLWREDTL